MILACVFYGLTHHVILGRSTGHKITVHSYVSTAQNL
jgi:hypothetical protein